MAESTLLVLGISLLLQIGAAMMALRLVRLTGWRATWVLIAAAITLMAVRRGITLYKGIGGDPKPPDLPAELVALTISVLMVLGIAFLGPLIESIRRAEREVRQLIESAPEAMIISDDSDRVVLANAEAGRLFGYFPHQLVGKDVQDLMPDRFRDRHRNARRAFYREPRRAAFSPDAGLCGVHADGHEFPVQISVSPLETASGLKVVASIRDMTEWETAQRALQESEGRYRTLLDDVLDNSSVAACILDADFKIVWVNRAYESYIGQERSDVVGLPGRQVVRERIGPVMEDGEGFAEKVLATYDDNTYTEHFECHVTAGNGRLDRWLEFWSQPIESGLYRGGRIEHFAEVTQRRHAEQRIRQFVHIARNMRIGLLVYHMEDLEDDKSLRVRILNPEGERIMGLFEGDITGRYIDEAFPLLRAKGIPELFAEVLRSGEAREVKDFEYGDDRVSTSGWSFRAFPLPDDCVGVLFERIDT